MNKEDIEKLYKNFDPLKDKEKIEEIQNIFQQYENDYNQLKEELNKKNEIINENNIKYNKLNEDYKNISDEYRNYIIKGVNNSKNEHKEEKPETLATWLDNTLNNLYNK